MDIVWFRDLSVTILGFAATIVFIISAVVLLRLYSAVKGVIAELKAASMVAHDTAARFQEGMRPILALFEMIQGMREGRERRSSKRRR
ncbi:MAG TPA: hypothetical protein ENL12_01805 [Dehalococcoidia bacterium]|nr:hypothetical protein [Dehalococcoidia bacterium]